MRVEKTEAEVKRGAPVKIGKTEFIPVTLKGTLTITNYRTGKAPVKVAKSARGKVLTQSDAGIVKQTLLQPGDPNPINQMEWKVEVAPGETKQIVYTVETMVPAGPSEPPAKDGESGRSRLT